VRVLSGALVTLITGVGSSCCVEVTGVFDPLVQAVRIKSNKKANRPYFIITSWLLTR
jgi:hypothetical protein